MRKKIFCILLSLAMVVTMMPAMAFAGGVGETPKTTAEILKEAKNYKYQGTTTYPAYTYFGNIETTKDTVYYNISVDKFVKGEESYQEGQSAIYDLSRFLGALWRVDSGKTVGKITYNEKTYEWITSGDGIVDLHGSNWRCSSDGNTTLISQISSELKSNTDYIKNNGKEFSFKLNNQDEIKLKASCVKYSPWDLLKTAMSSDANTSADSVTDLFTVTTADGKPSIKLLKNIKAAASDDALVVPSGKKLILDLGGKELDRGLEKSVDNGYVAKVEGELTVIDNSTNKTGKITGGNNTLKDEGWGGAFQVHGTLNLKGGTVTGNKAFGGGGVYLNGGNLTVEGGKIDNNYSSKNGGGIYATGGSEITLKAGSVSNNDAAVEGGGVLIYKNSKITINGGNISNNTAGTKGGGVCLNEASGSAMINGTISENKAYTGAGIHVCKSSFEMSGGTINKCTTREPNNPDNKECYLGRGGAVYVDGTGNGNITKGTFNMTGGTITECGAYVAGGAIYSVGDVTISGTSKITKCNVIGFKDEGKNKAKGGAVYMMLGKLSMSAGEISENTLGKTATNKIDEANGAGVYISSDASISLGGTAKIEKNSINGASTSNNLFLCLEGEGCQSLIDFIYNAGPSNGMHVGVTTSKVLTEATANSTCVISKNCSTDYSKYFFNDRANETVVYDAATQELQLKYKKGNTGGDPGEQGGTQEEEKTDEATMSLTYGESKNIKTGTYKDATSFTSDKTSVVTVDNSGNLTAVSTGTATITIKAGTKTYTLKVTINAKALTNSMVAAIDSQDYTGSEIKPSVTVKDGTKTLVNGTDYTVSYKNNKEVGTATATITGKGNYSGTVTKTFSILKVVDINIPDSTNGEPDVTLKDGTYTLKEGTDYTVTYKDNDKIGYATAVIDGKGSYAGLHKEIKFKVLPKKSGVKKYTVGKKQATVTWKKIAGVDGYWIKVATNKKFTKGVMNVKVSKGATTKKVVKKLKSGKKYYIKVRAYKKVQNGSAIESFKAPWSSTKRTKTIK